jgi:hypothetical protein
VTGPDVELEPDQPEPIVRAVAELLVQEAPPDPWWQAGIDAALADRP